MTRVVLFPKAKHCTIELLSLDSINGTYNHVKRSRFIVNNVQLLRLALVVVIST
jgi:hypothetical protein